MESTSWSGPILAAILVGHFGLSVAIYNRVNGFGWPRWVTKGLELILFVLAMLAPILTIVFHRELIIDWVSGRGAIESVPLYAVVYGVVCLAAWPIFGLPWVLWRPILGMEWAGATRDVELVDVQKYAGRRLALTTQCKLESRIPMNQIFRLAIERVELPVPGLPPSLDGYRIAHLSDVHLTGHVHPDFSRYAVEQATAWQPDLMALTGDIIDAQHCIDWLPEIFAPARAPDGCYFVLGNHDTRISDASQTRDAMDRAGWTDLGSRVRICKLADVPSWLIGNEHPWFGRPALAPLVESDGEATDNRSKFRLLLSHSPDQIWWARSHGVTLMLAGHTHGGQGRLPLLGPVLSPSFHGSRFASGDFFIPPTTMYVSRGISGTHLLRINCPPELTLLTLRATTGAD